MEFTIRFVIEDIYIRISSVSYRVHTLRDERKSNKVTDNTQLSYFLDFIQIIQLSAHFFFIFVFVRWFHVLIVYCLFIDD